MSWNFSWGSNNNNNSGSYNNNNNSTWSWGDNNNNNSNNNNNNSGCGFESSWGSGDNWGSGSGWGNTSKSWNWGQGGPWNYTYETDKATKTIAVTSKSDREYLVFGYGRTHNKSIPNDILTLCSNMFGLEGFSININNEYLKNSLYYQSTIFCCKDMNFQLILKTQEKNSSWGWSDNNDRLYFHIKLTQPQLFNHEKTAKIIALFTIYCPQLDTQFHSIMNTSFDMIENKSLTKQLGDYSSCFRIEDLKMFEFIEFIGNVDLLHVDILDTNMNILNVFHANTKMSKRVDYKWTLNIESTPEKKIYSSPVLDNNWSLICEQAKTWSNEILIRLNLLSMPPNLVSMDVLWHVLVECNGISYTTAKVETFRLDSHGLKCESAWLISEFGIKDTEKIKHVTFTTFIEIINAQTRSYENIVVDPKGSSGGWNWGSQGYKIKNEHLHSYGIIIGNDNINNNHRLLLQQTIKNVKQTKNRSNRDTNVNNSSVWSFGNVNTNANRSPLYIDHDSKEMNEIKIDDVVQEIDSIVERKLEDVDANDVKDEREEILSQRLENVISFADDKVVDGNNEQKGVNDIQDDGKNNEVNEKKYDTSTDAFDNFDWRPVKKEEGINEYKWIEKTLKGISPNKYAHILGNFQKHDVTDNRLNDLESNDWKELIFAIGIRNEMRKLVKQKKEKSEFDFIVSDSEL